PGDRFRYQRRLVGGQAGEQRHGFLVAAGLDDGDGIELVGLRRVRLEQQDRRAGLGQRSRGGLFCFLCQRLFDNRQRRRVMHIENRLRGGDPRGGIGRHQRQIAERSIDGAAHAVVGSYLGGTIGQLVNGGSRGRVNDLVVGLLDENLL